MKLDKIEIESRGLNFVNQDSMSVSYSKSFTSIPFVTATSGEDVNIFVEDVTSTSCTIRSSSKITGSVMIHIMGIK